MIQQITASLLLALMVLVTMTSYQGVSYCSNQKELFLFECPDLESTATIDSDCEDCITCEKKNLDGESNLISLTPSDCSIKFFFGDKNEWLKSENVCLSEIRVNELSSVWHDDCLLKPITNHSDITARGPPPETPLSPPVPIHIRHSVFLI